MDENVKKTLAERFVKLPKRLQEVIMSTETGKIIAEIAASKKLAVWQTTGLYNETMFLVYGIENPLNFLDNLQKEIKVTREEAVALAEEINNRIIKTIKEDLVSMYEKKLVEASLDEEPAAVSTKPPLSQSGIGRVQESAASQQNEVVSSTQPSPTPPAPESSINATTPTQNVSVPKKDLVSSNLAAPAAPIIDANISAEPVKPDPYREPI